jgi:hypothetical protein
VVRACSTEIGVQGLRSFHSLNPWLFSVHALGVAQAANSRYQEWVIVSFQRGRAAKRQGVCAEHVQQLGSESLLSNLMEVKD